jgi:predicted nucleic-acid-binding protein
MSWTVGKKMLKMRGTYWMQQTRTTVMKEQFVAPLIDNIRQAIMMYQAENDNFPDHIIVFRGGASEGEFKRVSQCFCL